MFSGYVLNGLPFRFVQNCNMQIRLLRNIPKDVARPNIKATGHWNQSSHRFPKISLFDAAALFMSGCFHLFVRWSVHPSVQRLNAYFWYAKIKVFFCKKSDKMCDNVIVESDVKRKEVRYNLWLNFPIEFIEAILRRLDNWFMSQSSARLKF